jgi:hypothetical protein
MKSYSTEELHKIQMFLRDGIISEGLEWISEKKDYGLRRRMKVHALTHGYGQALAHFADNLPNPNSQVQYADLHGPDDQCRIVLMLSYYPTISVRVRPKMLNLRGQFVEPYLAAAVEPWVNILHYMVYNIEYCTQFLYRITCVFDICPISGASDWASKTFSTEHFALVHDHVLEYSKHMFDRLLALIPREKILRIAAGSIAQEASTYILEGTGVTLVNGDVRLQHPSKGKNGWMTVEERHTYMAHSCKSMSGLVGQELSIDDLSYNQLDLVYGVCGSLELKWWEEHVNVTAGREVGYVTEWINEKIARECAREEEERARKEEKCAVVVRRKAWEEEEERARMEVERAREVARMKARVGIFDKECARVREVERRNEFERIYEEERQRKKARGLAPRKPNPPRKLCSDPEFSRRVVSRGVCSVHSKAAAKGGTKDGARGDGASIGFNQASWEGRFNELVAYKNEVCIAQYILHSSSREYN